MNKSYYKKMMIILSKYVFIYKKYILIHNKSYYKKIDNNFTRYL